MTDTHNTVNEEMLLAACRHYIRITETTDRQLVAEMFELAGQYCENMREEVLEQFSTSLASSPDEGQQLAQN